MRYLSRKMRVGIGLPLILGLTIFTSSCFSESDRKKIARAEDTFSQGLLSTATLAAEAKQLGFLNQEDINAIKPILQEVGNGHGGVIKVTKEVFAKYKKEIPLSEQQKILDAVNFVSDALVNLNNEGVLRIKNPERRAMFSAIVISMQSAVTTVATIFVKHNKKVSGKFILTTPEIKKEDMK